MKRIMKLFLAMIIAGAITIGGGYAYYHFFGSTPKKDFTYIIGKELNILMNEKLMKEDKQYVTMTLTPSETTGIKASLSIKFDTDKTNKTFANTNILTYNGEKALTINTYGKGNKLYLESQDLYSKIIYTDIEQAENINYDEVNEILKKIGNIIINNIPDKKFTKQSDKIEIEGQTHDTTRYTLTLSEKELGIILNDSIDDILSDNKLLNKIVNIYKIYDKEITIDSLKKDLENEKNTITDTYTNEEQSTFNVYKNKELVAFKAMGKGTANETIIYKYKNKYIFNYENQFKMTITPKETKNMTLYNIDISSINGNETTSIATLSIEMGKSLGITIPDTKNAQKYEELTETDVSEIMTNLYDLEPLQDILLMFSNNINNNYNSEYDNQTVDYGQRVYEFDDQGNVISDNIVDDDFS